MENSTELANLEQDNARRLNDLLGGKFGIAVRLEAGTFENLKLISHVEFLIAGLLPGQLTQAKLRAAEKASEALDTLEKEARKTALANPGSMVNGKLT